MTGDRIDFDIKNVVRPARHADAGVLELAVIARDLFRIVGGAPIDAAAIVLRQVRILPAVIVEARGERGPAETLAVKQRSVEVRARTLGRDLGEDLQSL